jgi:hypothetical protein
LEQNYSKFRQQYLFYLRKDNPSLGAPECVVSKLNANRNSGYIFGNNGETIISNYFSGEQSELKQMEKFSLCFYFRIGSAIVRLLPNGQLRCLFGINGIAKIDNIGTDYNNLQDMVSIFKTIK